MTPESCPDPSRLVAFHHGALPEAEAERIAAHLEGCERCEALMRDLDGESSTMLGALQGGAAITIDATAHAPSPVARADETLVAGRYRIGRPLGEGGMGVVYLAEQERPVRRRVALKVIKAGMDTAQVVARFEAERQALALMDHPNIARVLDAGSTAEGRPFFVMELIDGEPITAYCDRRRLPTRRRIELLATVCRAVQHAHQKGIIHRDLKPTNVLVAEVGGAPVPKVIDFGIAKATDADAPGRTLATSAGSVIGTPEYMSPEQAGGSPDVDTRADLYALGVILYELLTGSTPLGRETLLNAGHLEVLRRVREEEPPRPSARLADPATPMASASAVRGSEPTRLIRQVRGDLDWVTMRAIEKDRARRYATVEAFAADLRSYLDGDPVAAGPPSRTYRLAKAVRKHRLAVGVAASFVLVLAGATAVSLRQAAVAGRARDEAERARNLAERERASARATSDFLVDALAGAAPDRDGQQLKVVDVLDRAADRLGGDFKGRPGTRGELLSALSRTYLGLSLYPKSLATARESLRAFEADFGADDPQTVEARSALGIALQGDGRHAEAIALLEDLFHRPDLAARIDPKAAALARNSLALAYKSTGRPAEAIPIFEAIVAGSGAKELAGFLARFNLAVTLEEMGRLGEAIARMEALLKDEEAALGPDNSDTTRTRSALVAFYRSAKRPAEAIALGERSLTVMDKTHGPDHIETLSVRFNLSIILAESGRIDEGIAMIREAYERNLRMTGPTSPMTSSCRRRFAFLTNMAGRTAESVALYEEGLRADEGRVPRDDEKLLLLRTNLAEGYSRLGRFPEAIALTEETLRRREAKASLGPDHPDTMFSRLQLAQFYQQVGRPAEAIALVRANERARAASVAAGGPPKPEQPEVLVEEQALLKALSPQPGKPPG